MSRYYHGGRRCIARDKRVLPPARTGVQSSANTSDAESNAKMAKVHRADRVYLTTDLGAARVFAAMAEPGGGHVYEVEPTGPVERDPDYLPDDGGSVCCSSARVVRVVERRLQLPRGALAFLAAP